VICGSCDRDNDPKRRYCGKCGFNLQPVCRKCRFLNERDDRFCGGCGALLVAAHGCSVRPTVHPVGGQPSEPMLAVVPEPSTVTQTITIVAPPPPPRTFELSDELGGLFGSPIVAASGPALPEAGIGQEDLDKLFGVVP
jgi:hypothetical protein